MAIASKVKITGLKELQKALKAMPEAGKKAVLSRALSKAAKPVETHAELNAPWLTGDLAISVQTVIRDNLRNKDAVLAVIGPAMTQYRQLKTPVPGRRGKSRTYQIGGTPGVYGYFVEFGTSDTPARPFMRPAFEGNKGQALGIIKSELTAEVSKVAAKHKVSGV